MLAELLRYLEYPFVRYAIVAAMLISLCSALVGVILVLKRYSYIGDGLSHVAFGAMSIALVLGMIQQKMYLVFPITTVAAILILKSGQNKRVQGDAIVGMISTGALALGYLLMNLFPPTANISGDVCSTLFGSNIDLDAFQSRSLVMCHRIYHCFDYICDVISEDFCSNI